MPLRKKEPKNNISSILIKMGLVVLALSFCALLLIYSPVIAKELLYAINKPDASEQVTLSNQSGSEKEKKKEIVVADKEFSIVIPKIGVNSKVVKNVDPNKSVEYQLKLTQGVAHAKGTVFPGEFGNSFYFAHSSDSFYNANRYNSVFYLLNKLTKGDFFYLVYNQQIYKYQVKNVKVVEATDINYLSGDKTKQTATLMTCWPAGTTLKRLVVVGELIL
jgi:sortase A